MTQVNGTETRWRLTTTQARQLMIQAKKNPKYGADLDEDA